MKPSLFLQFTLTYLLTNLLTLYGWHIYHARTVTLGGRPFDEFGLLFMAAEFFGFIILALSLHRLQKHSKSHQLTWGLLGLIGLLLGGLFFQSSALLDTLSSALFPLHVVHEQIRFIQVLVFGLSLGGVGWGLVQAWWPIKSRWHIPPYLIPTLLFLAFSTSMIWFLNHRHITFDTYARDLGIFDQAVWHLSHFQAPASTIRGVETLWADHFHPILALFAPLYWLWSDARMLLFAQVLIVAAGVFPLFALARRRFDGLLLPTAFSVLYLTYLPIQNALKFGFYPENLLSAFLAYLFYFLDRKLLWPATVAALLMLFTKENTGLYLVALGIYYAFQAQPWRRWGWGAIVLGLAWFLGTVKVLIPHLLGDPYPYFTYKQLGDTPLEALRAIFHPLETWVLATNHPIKIETLLVQTVPTLFLFIFSHLALVGLPMIAESFLSDRPSQWTVGFHYAAPISVILIVAALFGLERLLKQWPKAASFLKTSIGLALIGTSLALNILVESPLWRVAAGRVPNPVEAKHALVAEALRHVPAAASVTAQSALAPHLSQRMVIYDDDAPMRSVDHYPLRNQTDYVVYARGLAYYPYNEIYLKKKIPELLARGYGVAYANEWTLLLAKDGREPLPPVWQEFLQNP